MNQRIKELDGIRGIAILMVIIWHYIPCQSSELAPKTFLAYIKIPTSAFWSGVDLFFVLSGFLIGGIILDNCHKESFLKIFWIRRVCRIFPVLFLLLTACWISSMIVDLKRFGWLFDNLMPWWTYVTFTQNIAMGMKGEFGGNFLGITWSLAVEEQFYLLAPLLILAVGKKKWLKLLIPLILTAFLLRVLFPGRHIYVNMIFRMDALLLGALIAAIYRHKTFWQLLLSCRASVFASLTLLVCATGIFILKDTKLNEFKFSWYALLYSTFLLFALLYQSSPLTSLLRTRLLGFFGAVSYGLYMYHQAVAGFLHIWLRNEIPSINNSFGQYVTMLSFFVSVILAWLSLKYFEAPFLKLGSKYTYEKEPDHGRNIQAPAS